MRLQILSAAVLSAMATVSMATTVFPNNPGGETFTNAGTSNQGQAIGATGWYYNNVRNSGVVGINSNYPRSGTGSAYLETTIGPGGNSSKADIELLANGVNVGGNYYAAGSFGSFASLTRVSYDWYRDSASTNSSVQHPALRILLDADGDLSTTNDRGGLVFERAYNGGGSAPTDTWVSDAISASTNLWNFGLGIGNEANINATPYAYDANLSEWQAYFPHAVVLGVSAGVGSGWGPFKGAVDNIGLEFTTTSYSYNFEVVPLPAAAWAGIALFGSLGAAKLVRRNKTA